MDPLKRQRRAKHKARLNRLERVERHNKKIKSLRGRQVKPSLTELSSGRIPGEEPSGVTPDLKQDGEELKR